MIRDDVKVLLKLAPEDISQDGMIDFQVRAVTKKILNYCNLDALPEGLEEVAARMVVEIMSPNSGRTESVQRGDTRISYAASSGADWLSGYTEELDRYRRMKVL